MPYPWRDAGRRLDVIVGSPIGHLEAQLPTRDKQTITNWVLRIGALVEDRHDVVCGICVSAQPAIDAEIFSESSSDTRSIEVHFRMVADEDKIVDSVKAQGAVYFAWRRGGTVHVHAFVVHGARDVVGDTGASRFIKWPPIHHSIRRADTRLAAFLANECSQIASSSGSTPATGSAGCVARSWLRQWSRRCGISTASGMSWGHL